MSYNVVFFGTSDFSVPSLKSLLDDSRFKVVAVVTKPDAAIGRHQTITPPPIKSLAQQHSVPVLQFEKIKTTEVFEELQAIQNQHDIDVFVVVSYGKIIPQRILDLPKHGCINVHGSLLPRWRGASCVQAAIAAGDKKTGVTVMLLDAEMDHGPILEQRDLPINQEDTGGILHDNLALLGATILPDVLLGFIDGEIQPQEQNHAAATNCKILTRDDGRLDWNKSATELERLVRAYNPWPGTWTDWQGKRIKILHSNLSTITDDSPIALGKPLALSGKIFIRCGDGQLLEISSLQPEGKKPMSAKEYLAGHII